MVACVIFVAEHMISCNKATCYTDPASQRKTTTSEGMPLLVRVKVRLTLWFGLLSWPLV